MERRLSLRSEHLTALTPAELGAVAGAGSWTLDGCLTDYATGHFCVLLSIACLTHR